MVVDGQDFTHALTSVERIRHERRQALPVHPPARSDSRPPAGHGRRQLVGGIEGAIYFFVSSDVQLVTTVRGRAAETFPIPPGPIDTRMRCPSGDTS